MLTEFELGWVVGILEGEGCFFITRRTKALMARTCTRESRSA
jgi:hypothetical protein